MIVSSTDVLGFIHSCPERYVGHGLGGHTCRGSDLVWSVAITFNKANNEAGLSHFLFQYSFCLWLLGYTYVFFALQQNSKAVEGENSSAPTFKHQHTESRPKHQALQICSLSSRIHRQDQNPTGWVSCGPHSPGPNTVNSTFKVYFQSARHCNSTVPNKNKTSTQHLLPVIPKPHNWPCCLSQDRLFFIW